MEYLEKCNNLYSHITGAQLYFNDGEFNIIATNFDKLMNLTNQDNIGIMHNQDDFKGEEYDEILDSIDSNQDFINKKNILISSFNVMVSCNITITYYLP